MLQTDVRPIARHRGDSKEPRSQPQKRPYVIVATKQSGTVKSYDGSNGYGFIKPDGGGKDVFVHRTALSRIKVSVLKQGQRLNFAICKETQGKNAGRFFADELERA